MQRLHSSPLHASPHSLRRCADGGVYSTLRCRAPPLHDDAGQAAHNHFHDAFVIDAALRSVDIGQAYRDALDRGCELAKSRPKLACDRLSILAVERDAKYSYMSGRPGRMSPAPFALGRARDG